MVEELREALKVAKEEGANLSLIENTAQLYHQLVAQKRELPAECCVLDPEGEGIKLLPMGTKRAVWTTGEVYTYNVDTGAAGEVGDPLPPAEQLASVSVDDARPICA